MRMIRTFMTILNRAIRSKMFLITVLMVFVFRMLDFGPLILQANTIIDGEFRIMYSIMELYQLVGVTMFGLMMLIVPVLVYSSAFCQDITSNYLTYVLINTGKTRYSIATVTVCAISSFLCVILGELLVIAVLSPFASLYDITAESKEYALTLVFTRVILLGLQGAFYGVVTMLLSVFTRSKFVIYTMPLLLYFFFMYFGGDILNISNKINPAHIYIFYIFGEGEAIKSVWYAFAYMIGVLLVAIIAMRKKIERCY